MNGHQPLKIISITLELQILLLYDQLTHLTKNLCHVPLKELL